MKHLCTLCNFINLKLFENTNRYNKNLESNRIKNVSQVSVYNYQKINPDNCIYAILFKITHKKITGQIILLVQ